MQATPKNSGSKDIRELLDDIFEVLRRASVTDNQEIIEYIAFLLLDMSNTLSLIPQQFRPRQPGGGYGGYELEVRRLLEIAVKEAKSEDKLFDHYVLFQKFDVTDKGAYFIPRHIIRFMLQTLNIQDKETFADFTCGSGGFLVHRYTDSHPKQSGESFGIDINPDVLRIAYANVTLHDLAANIQLFLGDAFYTLDTENLSGKLFDCIAMAPPFGVTIDEEAAKKTLDVKAGLASEQMFTRLALKKLNEHGRATIIVPNTLLTNNRRAEALKRDIFDSHTLRAVISLGAGALYPFNNLDTGLLLLEKTHYPTVHPWMFNVIHDGYQRKRGRDITQEPGESDFPLVLDALHMATFSPAPVPTDASNAPSDADPSPLSFALLSRTNASSEGRNEQGYVFKANEQAVLQKIWLINEYKQGPESSLDRYLLVQAAYLPDYPVRSFVLPLQFEPGTLPSPMYVDDRAWLKERTKIRNLNSNELLSPTGSDIFSNVDNQRGLTVAILADGRLLGCTRSIEHIKDAKYDLRPFEYLNALSPGVPLTENQLNPLDDEEHVQEEHVPTARDVATRLRLKEPEKSPATLLHDAKQQLALVRRQANILLGELEMKPFKEMPPRIADEPIQLQVLERLDEEQSDIWDIIQKRFVDAGHPYHFTRAKLHQEMESEHKDVVKLQSTLDLLEQLGVIVRVTVNADFLSSESSRSRSVVYYRLVTSHDIMPRPQ